MSEELFLTHRFFDLQIHAFVLMRNHFHLIATTPNSNISEAMNYFMSRTSRRLTEAGNRVNQTYGGRHYKCILHSNQYFMNTYKYVYRNPVDAGVCFNAADYKFSTLNGLLGLQRLTIPLVEDSLLFEDPIRVLNWINQKPPAQKLEAMKLALRRNYFRSPKSKTNGRLIIEKNDVL